MQFLIGRNIELQILRPNTKSYVLWFKMLNSLIDNRKINNDTDNEFSIFIIFIGTVWCTYRIFIGLKYFLYCNLCSNTGVAQMVEKLLSTWDIDNQHLQKIPIKLFSSSEKKLFTISSRKVSHHQEIFRLWIP